MMNMKLHGKMNDYFIWQFSSGSNQNQPTIPNTRAINAINPDVMVKPGVHSRNNDNRKNNKKIKPMMIVPAIHLRNPVLYIGLQQSSIGLSTTCLSNVGVVVLDKGSAII